MTPIIILANVFMSPCLSLSLSLSFFLYVAITLEYRYGILPIPCHAIVYYPNLFFCWCVVSSTLFRFVSLKFNDSLVACSLKVFSHFLSYFCWLSSIWFIMTDQWTTTTTLTTTTTRKMKRKQMFLCVCLHSINLKMHWMIVRIISVLPSQFFNSLLSGKFPKKLTEPIINLKLIRRLLLLFRSFICDSISIYFLFLFGCQLWDYGSSLEHSFPFFLFWFLLILYKRHFIR